MTTIKFCKAKALRHNLPNITAQGWAMLVLCGIATALTICCGWLQSFAIAISSGALCLLSFIQALRSAPLQTQLVNLPDRTSVGSRVTASIQVTHTGHIPAKASTVTIPIGNSMQHIPIPALLPQQSITLPFSFTAEQREVLVIGPATVQCGDVFGLFQRNAAMSEHYQIHVAASTVAIRQWSLRGNADCDGLSSQQVVDDDLEFYALRQYTCNDDARRIHWPSSVRTQQPLLRQYVRTLQPSLVLLLNTHAQQYSSSEEFELAVSLHTSLALYAVQHHAHCAVRAGQLSYSAHSQSQVLDYSSQICEHNSTEQNPHVLVHSDYVVFVTGSAVEAQKTVHFQDLLSNATQYLIVQANSDQPSSIQRKATYTELTVQSLADLPLLLGVLR
ncbi:hypothetical protein D2E26_0130 [Bifidobacterium dolichotidis]|uniref:Uncharacterized protein n=1 Tax=Bifidobacterium dolichotidis TaxID=2306976 RepID=A0A430FRU4_9BIFI|nr:DUF58 domain-containing protein [Bifidobacterium dolichotidis]RSX55567.1 hypothetical protein D2E26_0130 [Bifidobacterium dolichotidis]